MAKVDDDTKAVLRDLSSIEPLTKGDPDIAVVRSAYDEVFAAWTAPAKKKTKEWWVSGCGLGSNREALVIEPASHEPIAGTLILIHGGGWSLGNALGYAPLGRWLCAETGMRVLVPDFPQAPEHPSPAAFDALSEFLVWTASAFGNALKLIGDSAGGNLAAVLSNHPPEGIAITAQVLLYPVIDLRPDAVYRSRKKYGAGRHFLTTDGIVGAAMQYCGDAQNPSSPFLTPLLEEDFSRTPPTMIMVPQFDPLQDECNAYGTLLQENDIETHFVFAEATIHGCASFSGRIGSGRAALVKACGFLRSEI